VGALALGHGSAALAQSALAQRGGWNPHCDFRTSLIASLRDSGASVRSRGAEAMLPLPTYCRSCRGAFYEGV